MGVEDLDQLLLQRDSAIRAAFAADGITLPSSGADVTNIGAEQLVDTQVRPGATSVGTRRWAAGATEHLLRASINRPDSGDVPPPRINPRALGKSPGLGHPWWVLPAGGISARRIAGW